MYSKKKTFEQTSSYISPESKTSIIRNEVIEETDFYRGEVYNYPFYYFQNAWNIPNGEIEFQIDFLLAPDDLVAFPYLLDNGIYVVKDSIPFVLAGKFSPKSFNSFEIILSQASVDGNLIYSHDGAATNFFPTIKGGSDELQLIEFLRRFNNIVLLIDSDRYFQDEEFFYNPNLDLNSKSLKQWYYSLSLDFEKGNQLKNIEHFINGFQITDPENENPNFQNLPFVGAITVQKVASTIEVFLKNGNLTLPIRNFGTGIQQIFYILTKIFSSPADIILIEEFELNLSKRYQVEFLKYLKAHVEKMGKQLIFTSHSPYIANEPGLISSHYQVEISSQGLTTITHQTRGESGYQDWIAAH